MMLLSVTQMPFNVGLLFINLTTRSMGILIQASDSSVAKSSIAVLGRFAVKGCVAP
jgi:hypothetical protein